MFLFGDLGFPSLVLVVSLVVAVIGFVIRRKWRLAVARQEEVKRLLAFAAAEAARAEFEASLSYGAVSVSKAYHQCELCYAPTTMRCSRCKAVRYCSKNCQYIHWGRRHKDECHPLAYNTTLQNNDENSLEEDQHERLEIGGRSHLRPTKASPGEQPSSDTATFSGILLVKEENIKGECLSDIEGADCVSESFSSSFSGFSTSPSSLESSDESSLCESVSSSESERSEPSDRPQSVDTALHGLWTASGVNDVNQIDSLSPKFANLVNSVDKFSKLNKMQPDSGESKCSEPINLDLGISETGKGQSAEECKSSSSSWSRTLEPAQSRNGGGNKSSLTSSNGDGRCNLSDSESTLKFSFNLSGNTLPSPCTQGSKVNGVILNGPIPATLSEDINLEARSSHSLKLERSNLTDGVSSNVSHVLKSANVELSPKSPCIELPSGSEGRSINASNGLQSVKSGGALSSDSGHTSRALNSRDNVRLSVCANSQSSSGVKVERVPSMKSEKVDVFHGKSATSPNAVCPNSKNGFKTSMWKVVDQFRGSKLPKHFHIGSENEVAGRYKDKGIFPYELFVKLYNSNKVELQPCGLINCGNSCYANAVLQCLAFTPPLTSYFLQGFHSDSCEKKEWCFTCEFENLILKAKEGKSVLSPIGILSQLQKIGSQLGNGKEEDAHEFLRYAIDTMQSVCLREAGVNLGSSEEETTLIGQTFGGYLRSKIQCMNCQGKSERHERMMDLTVEIEGDIGTLEEALRRFTGTEILDGENKYHCSRCKSYEKAKKKLTILEAPNILTIALKRFQSGKFGKLNKSIRFPEILYLAPYMSGTSDRSPVYRLYGVVVHLDIMNAAFSGHYVCYVKNAQNKWFKIDDRTVTTSELERVLSKGAYMLLYARCSPRAPRMIRSKITSLDTKSKRRNPSSGSQSSTHSGVSQSQPSSSPPDSPSSIDSFYSNYQRLQRILEEDSFSDSSSLFSTNSDECSSSTDSTRDSSSADDLTEFIFGESSLGWNSPWRNSSDSDSPSSSYSRDLDHYVSGSPDPFFHSDTSKKCRKLDSSSYRETNSERLGRGSSFGSGVPFRRSVSERTE